MGVSEVPLAKAEFMEEPRKVVQLDVPFYKPEAHGHLLKLAKVGAHLIVICCLLRCPPNACASLQACQSSLCRSFDAGGRQRFTVS